MKFLTFFFLTFPFLFRAIKSPIFIHKQPGVKMLINNDFDPSPSLDGSSQCPCQKEAQKCPPCNPFEFTRSQFNCPCAPKKSCPPCILAKTQKFVHEQAEKEAKAQAQTEESLSREAQLQSKLFQLAMKFAKEASEQEELARKAALALQQASSKAQIARNKMKRATNQARLLAIKAISTISTNQLDKNHVVENTPKGSVDLQVPQSLEEATLNNELEASMEMTSDVGGDLANENKEKQT